MMAKEQPEFALVLCSTCDIERIHRLVWDEDWVCDDCGTINAHAWEKDSYTRMKKVDGEWVEEDE